MKITLDIKDSNYYTFLEFIKTLNYVSVSNTDDIPKWQKNEVLNRIKTTPREAYLTEEEFESKLDLRK